MFFLSLFLILFLGFLINLLFKKIKIPALIGYLILGVILNYTNLLDIKLLNISAEIRKLALIIILIRAGLSLNIEELKKVGRPAILLSFLPACVEMITIGLVAHFFFDLSYIESFLLGSVIGAVSPAVVVPRMTRFIEEKRGTSKGIPQMIVAGSSIDDIIMIVFFTAFLGLEQSNEFNAAAFLDIPLSIVLGIAVGIIIGFGLFYFFKLKAINLSFKIIVIFSICALLTYIEAILPFGYSSLLSIIVIGIVLLKKNPTEAKGISNSYNNLWIIGEMFLFVMLGAQIELDYLLSYLGLALIVLGIGLLMRMIAVAISLIKTGISFKEKIFVGISYLPKATVQASLGGELLALGISMNNEAIIKAGTIVLSISVVSITFTAPLTALAIDLSYKWFLNDDSLI